MMRVPGFVRVASEVTIGLAVLLVAAAATAGPRDLPLIDAVRSSDRARLAALLDQRVNPDASLPDGTTALHWAVRVDDPVAVDALIRAGANVRATTRFGVTPLALAATNGSAL
ncbi:MAG: ankyrin repeat domain-containing protein, partial [Acidimicrobiia bacterium]|nr:ankyrin repeat domain-containing protein [Acidimicrobiia bacterium]